MIYNNYRYSFFNEDDDMSTDDETVEVDVDELEGKDYSDTATVAESVYLAMYEDAHNWNRVSDILNEESILDKIKKVFDTIIKVIKEWIEKIIGMITGFINKLRKKFFAMGLKNWLKDNKDKLLKSKTTIKSYTGYDLHEVDKTIDLLESSGIIDEKFYTAALDNFSSDTAANSIESIAKKRVERFAGSNVDVDSVSADEIIEYRLGTGEQEVTSKILTPNELAGSVDGFKETFNKLIKLENECKKSGKGAIDKVNKVKKDATGEDAKEAAKKCMKAVRLANRWNTVAVSVCFKLVNYLVKTSLDLCKVYVSGKSSGNIIVNEDKSKSNSKNESALEAFSFI